MNMISLVVPCYNEEIGIKKFYEASKEVLEKLPIECYEYIFIDDGSYDKTLGEIKKLKIEDNNVKYLSFSRNFGKEAAMIAGLQHAVGDYVSILDVDLQDPPELLLDMYEIIISEEYDCVAARRVNRTGEPPIRSFFAKCFYKLINKISDFHIEDGVRDFRLMKRNVVNSIIELSEKNRFSKGLFVWVGFKTKYITYENINRFTGKSKWSFSGLFRYSIEGIISFSNTPLHIASLLGFSFSVLAVILIIFFVFQKMVIGIEVDGWASMMSIILLLGGIQLLCIGVVGEYLARIFTEVKNRPIYVLREHSFGNHTAYDLKHYQKDNL